jgi:hypothetical protein
MQAPDFREMQSDLVDRLTGRIPQAPKEEVRASVEEEFKRMTDEEKIMSLSEDEVDLLMKFRAWSQSSSSASGAFHWRKQYGKKF